MPVETSITPEAIIMNNDEFRFPHASTLAYPTIMPPSGAAVCKQDAALLAIVGEEVGEFAHRVAKRLQARQVDYAEVAWGLPIKTFAVHNQQLLIA